MLSDFEFPKQRIIGRNYRIEDPEIEFHGLVGVVEGSHLLLKEQGSSERLAEPYEQLGILLAIRHAFKVDMANGKADEIGMVIVSRVGGIALYRTGILTANDFIQKQICEVDEMITVPDIDLRDPLMHPWQKLKVGISSELDASHVITAHTDGTLL